MNTVANISGSFQTFILYIVCDELFNSKNIIFSVLSLNNLIVTVTKLCQFNVDGFLG